MSFRILSIFLLLLLLAACGGQPTPLLPTGTTLPTETRQPSRTPTQQLSAAVTIARTSRPTSTITLTVTKTPRPTRIVTRTRKPTPTSTIDATTTAIVANLISTVQPHRTSFVSPDQQWDAQLLTYDCTKIMPDGWDENAYDLLQIVSIQDGKIITIADQLQYCGGIGAYGLGGIIWSPNSRFFYFTYAAYGVPDGADLGWQRPTSRYDTVTGQIEVLVGPFSPDNQKIAMVQYQNDDRCLPQAFVAQTLNGDILASYPIENAQGDCQYGWYSNISWDSSSQELAYLETPCDKSGCKSTLYRIDLGKNERTMLIADHQPSFLDVTWPQPDLLTLTDEGYQTWYYTLSTGQLEQQVK